MRALRTSKFDYVSPPSSEEIIQSVLSTSLNGEGIKLSPDQGTTHLHILTGPQIKPLKLQECYTDQATLCFFHHPQSNAPILALPYQTEPSS